MEWSGVEWSGVEWSGVEGAEWRGGCWIHGGTVILSISELGGSWFSSVLRRSANGVNSWPRADTKTHCKIPAVNSIGES